MIIVCQDKSLISMDKISYLYISAEFHVLAEIDRKLYTIGEYESWSQAEKQIEVIRQGIEENWKTCEVEE